MRGTLSCLALGFCEAIVLASCGAALAADTEIPSTSKAGLPTSFFLVNNNWVSYRHEFDATEPGVGRGIQKDIIGLTHFDVWKYGTNFVNVDFLKSDRKDPSRDGDGAWEVYGLFRSTLSYNSITGTKTFAVGPLKDVGLYFGADANTKDTDFAPRKRDVVAGVQFNFGLYKDGYINVAPMYYKEWNHNGIVNENVEFDGAFRVEADYAQQLGDWPVTFRGYAHITGPKGKDGFGAETATEFHTENRLVLDIGKVTTDEMTGLGVYIGHSYWQNKFGSDHEMDSTGGSTQNAFLVGIEYDPFARLWASR